MAATSRWVRYAVAGSTGFNTLQIGTPGYVKGTASTADAFTIPASANNQMKVNIDGASSPAPYQITLTSGTSLDPRFVARDIQRKIQAVTGVNTGFDYTQVYFDNLSSSNGKGQFRIISGTAGSSSSVAITDGDSSVLTILGLNTQSTVAGTVNHQGTSTGAVNASYTGTATVSGVYRGAFDDVYNVVIAPSQPISSTVAYGGGNTYGVANAGVATVGGFWNGDNNETYTVTISTTNGQTVGGGTGNVPTFTVTSNQSDNIATAQEILYPDYPYYIGTRGLLLKWTDAPFGNSDTFTITCTKPLTVDGSNATAAVGTAKYIWRSYRHDDATVASTTSIGGAAIGTKGLVISWTNSGVLTPRDEWKIFCKGPTPEAYNVTNMVYGNVTVTTESPVKIHQFEIMSGAVVMSSMKFSLQSHGTFQHHSAGNNDTFFRFATVGAGYPGDGTAAQNGPEWTTSVVAADLATAKTLGNTGAPIGLAATKVNLSVVSSADTAETVGNVGLASDFILTNVRLGAEESGANSTIVYRAYFDYS
jgi:hypothetical protein